MHHFEHFILECLPEESPGWRLPAFQDTVWTSFLQSVGQYSVFVCPCLFLLWCRVFMLNKAQGWSVVISVSCSQVLPLITTPLHHYKDTHALTHTQQGYWCPCSSVNPTGWTLLRHIEVWLCISLTSVMLLCSVSMLNFCFSKIIKVFSVTYQHSWQ